MPFYEYQCKNCGHDLEAMQKINDPPLKKCPHCGKSQLQRLMSAPVFRLKGAGWYETDFKGDGDNKKNLADKPEADAPKEAVKDSKDADGKGKDKDAKTADSKETAKPADKAADKPAEKATAAAADSGKKAAAGKPSKRGAAPAHRTSKRPAKPVKKAAAKRRR